MMPLRHILCPVDFSEFSRHALDWAAAFARTHGADITALHVLPTLPPSAAAGGEALYPAFVFTPQDLEQFRQELSTFAAPSSAGVPVTPLVVQGYAVREIVAQAAGCDLLVMGTHGRSGFDRLFLGSVTERVLVKAPCPVLTVPPRVPDALPPGRVPYSHIVCAVDFSPASVKALAYARAITRGTPAVMTAVTVLEPVRRLEPVYAGGPGTPEFDVQAHEVLAARLHDAVGDPGDTHIDEIVADGKAYEAILRVAASRGADLIVLGAHAGRAGLLGNGSTMNQVVRRATCPVLTVKP